MGIWKSPTATSTATSVTMGALVPSSPAIAGDFDGNGQVNGADLSTLLNGWGTAAGDLNGDSNTDGGDLAILLNNWS